nr:serine protease inhibitor swm-1-like [Helicoverpa armigera]
MMKYTCVALFSCWLLFCIGVNSECGKNEEWKCVQSCPPEKSCNTRDIGIGCTAVYRPCESTCVCKPGFIRNDNNECVTEDQCEICSRENEFYDCGTPCDNFCSTLTERNRTHCDVWSYRCVRKCYCKDGFARDDNRKCIPIAKCPGTPKYEDCD